MAVSCDFLLAFAVGACVGEAVGLCGNNDGFCANAALVRKIETKTTNAIATGQFIKNLSFISFSGCEC